MKKVDCKKERKQCNEREFDSATLKSCCSMLLINHHSPEGLIQKTHFLSGLLQHSLILDPVLENKKKSHRNDTHATRTKWTVHFFNFISFVDGGMLTIGNKTNFWRNSWESYLLRSPNSAGDQKKKRRHHMRNFKWHILHDDALLHSLTAFSTKQNRHPWIPDRCNSQLERWIVCRLEWLILGDTDCSYERVLLQRLTTWGSSSFSF